MEDDFALRYARIYPSVNSRAELVTLAPGLRPERRRWLGTITCERHKNEKRRERQYKTN